MTAAALVLAIVAQASPPDTGAGRPCVLVIDSIGRNYREVPAGAGKRNA